jgi:queuine tRNA-ribosyltransferase
MFKVINKSKQSNARTGVVHTQHGSIKTPCFLPDATRASIRSLTTDDLSRLGLQSMVVNTYHLFLQPGISRIKKFKGVHNFMNYKGPLVSDSGGYQVFSLVYRNRNMGKIQNSGVTFKSPYDGKEHVLTPKKSIQIQFDMGTDLMVCFDDVPPHDIGSKGMEKSIEHTIAWAKICKKEFDLQIKKRKLKNNPPMLFGVIQGGIDKKLRKKCATALLEIGFDGYGFGARPVDDEGNLLGNILDYTARLIPDDKLRFNLGMGTPSDILQSVKMGWDLFDCVIPTREARHGRLYINKGKSFSYETVTITNSRFAKDLKPINALSKLPELREYTKSYLHHLFRTKEPLSIRLATLNNLEFYMDLMSQIRKEIKSGKL